MSSAHIVVFYVPVILFNVLVQ